MRKKREGDTLGEKIMKALGKVNEKEVSLHIDDAFYLKEVEGGLPFQVRRTDLLREKAKKGLSFGRCYDIPDEMELRANHLAAIEEVENTRDRTFEEFLEMFKDHIEGKKDPNDRVANRPDTAEAREAAKEKAEERERANESVEGSRKYQSIGSQGRASAASESKYSSQRQTTGKAHSVSDMKHDLPKGCKLKLSAHGKVKDLDDGYMLMAHPYPQLEGEMLLVQLNPADGPKKKAEEQKDDVSKNSGKSKKDEDESPLIYRDYSLRKRHFTMAKVKAGSKSALAKKHEMEQDQTKTKLQCLEIDLEVPLSSIDWNYVALTISEIDAMVWF